MTDHLTWEFVLVEGGNYLVAALCLGLTWRRARHLTVLILAAVVFGYALELSAVRSDELYQYHLWLVRLPGPVPLGVSLGWGVIMLAVWRTAENLRLPLLVRSLFAGLLATGIDWMMDPAFVRLGIWSWLHPAAPGQGWYGIPWRNFPSWFMVVFCFMTALQLAWRVVPPATSAPWKVAAAAAAATVPAFVALWALMSVYYGLADLRLPWLPEYRMVLLVFGTAAAIVIRYLPSGRRHNALDVLSLLPAYYLCACSLVTVMLSGLHVVHQELIIVAPVFVVTTLVAFTLPHVDTLMQGGGGAAGGGGVRT